MHCNKTRFKQTIEPYESPFTNFDNVPTVCSDWAMTNLARPSVNPMIGMVTLALPPPLTRGPPRAITILPVVICQYYIITYLIP